MMRIALALAFLSACKGDLVRCEKACRNYATLTYWKKHDLEIAAAPPERRAAMKHDALARFQNGLEEGIDLCINQCTSANNDDQTTCMIEAKTADALDACGK
jgi:hypothetical protein